MCTSRAPLIKAGSVFRHPEPPLYQSRASPGNLVSEQIVSRELGYLLNAQRYGLLLDARIFDDALTSLISERTSMVGPAPTNDSAVHLRGAELQTSVQWSPRWSGFLNYAYLQNSGATSSGGAAMNRSSTWLQLTSWENCRPPSSTWPMA